MQWNLSLPFPPFTTLFIRRLGQLLSRKAPSFHLLLSLSGAVEDVAAAVTSSRFAFELFMFSSRIENKNGPREREKEKEEEEEEEEDGESIKNGRKWGGMVKRKTLATRRHS